MPPRKPITELELLAIGVKYMATPAMQLKEAAAQVGASESYLRNRFREKGIKIRRQPKGRGKLFDQATQDEIIRRYLEDELVSLNELAQKYYVSPRTIKNYLVRNGVTVRNDYKYRRKKKFATKYTAEQIADFRYFYWDCGRSCREVAEVMNQVYPGLNLTEAKTMHDMNRLGIPLRTVGEAVSARFKRRRIGLTT